MVKVGIIIGSIRENSLSERVAKAVATLLPENYEAEYLEIGNLPLYNPDLDQNTPVEYTNFRKAVAEVDAFIFVTPEHNRSIPAALKNALDIVSVPNNEWNGKPALIVSQSPGLISGFGANHSLRQVLTFLNMPMVQQPEVYLAETQNLIDENGDFLKEGTEEFLQAAVDALTDLADSRMENIKIPILN